MWSLFVLLFLYQLGWTCVSLVVKHYIEQRANQEVDPGVARCSSVVPPLFFLHSKPLALPTQLDTAAVEPCWRPEEPTSATQFCWEPTSWTTKVSLSLKRRFVGHSTPPPPQQRDLRQTQWSRQLTCSCSDTAECSKGRPLTEAFFLRGK